MAHDTTSPAEIDTSHTYSHDCADHHHATLTHNEELVFDVLKGGGGPMKAYDLLDQLKNRGVRAPMTVYRALDGLEAKGIVHKLDTMKSYVLCSHDEPHNVQTFLVCTQCEGVVEVAESVAELPVVETNIKSVVRASHFKMTEARLEIKGTCQACADKAT